MTFSFFICHILKFEEEILAKLFKCRFFIAIFFICEDQYIIFCIIEILNMNVGRHF